MLCVVSCTKQYEMSIAKADERETQLTSEIKTLEVELVQLREAHAEEVCGHVMHFV